MGEGDGLVNSVRKPIADKALINKALNWLDAGLCKIIDSGKAAYVEIGIHDPRSGDSNRKFHAMMGDINRQAVIKAPGVVVQMADYQPDACKALLVSWFAREKALMGEPLRHPGRVIIDPLSGEQIHVRPSTTQFSKSEAGQFIEWLYALGADSGVIWSEPALRDYQNYREAQ